MATKSPIVIIGGGFAGLRVALDLDRAFGAYVDIPIYLIDSSPDHIYTPSLYEVTSEITPRVPAIPFEDIILGTHIHFIQEKVIHIDTAAKQVITEHRRLPYADLVIALGSQCKPATKGSEGDTTFTYKTLDDVLVIKQHIIDSLQEVKRRPPQKLHSHFIVAGAGPSGVEFVCGLREFLNKQARLLGIAPEGVQITLVESGDKILSRFPVELGKKVKHFLRQKNITLSMKTKMAPKTKNEMAVNDTTVPVESIFWTIGVQAHCLVRDLPGAQHDEHGHVLVDPSLQVLGLPNVWAGGDSASVADAGLAWSALAHGKHIARAIIATRNANLPPPYEPIKVPVVLPLSSTYGVAWFGTKKIWDGISVIWYKRFMDLRYYLSILPIPLALKLWFSHGREVEEKNGRVIYKTRDL